MTGFLKFVINHRPIFFVQKKKKQEKLLIVLAGVAHWIDGLSANQRVAGQFDSQSGYMPGLQARSPVEGVREATTH